MATLDEHLATIRRLLHNKQLDEAVQAVSDATRECGDVAVLRMKLGYILEAKRDYDGAIAQATSAHGMEPDNVSYLFTRGRWRMNAGDYATARDDFSLVLAAPDEKHRTYFKDAALLFRGYCSLRIGSPAEALSDAAECEESGSLWILGGLIDKATLIERAKAAISGQKDR